MEAVIKTGGKQYRVAPGDVIEVELLDLGDEPEEGTEITFDQVLLVADGDGEDVQVGPDLSDATVKATFVGRVRGPKIRVFKFKRRKRYRRTRGHRQNYHQVKIESIEA